MPSVEYTTDFDDDVLLFKYNLAIILFVGLIVVVGNTISTLTSTGTTLLTQPIKATLDVIVGPIIFPAESAN